MDEQYKLFMNNFNEHFNQLKMCETKVSDVLDKTNKLCDKYTKNLNATKKDVANLVDTFYADLNNVTADKIEEASINANLVRERNSFFVTSYDCLSTGECDTKKQIKTYVGKLNLLLEASLKLKFFIVDRAEKVKAKFPSENHKALDELAQNTIKIADEINIKASKLNASVAFSFALELELNSKLQTFEAVVSELKKRFNSLG